MALHDPVHNPPMTFCRGCGDLIRDITGGPQFCNAECREFARHANCADEPCEDCLADARDDFDHALDCARDAGAM